MFSISLLDLARNQQSHKIDSMDEITELKKQIQSLEKQLKFKETFIQSIIKTKQDQSKTIKDLYRIIEDQKDHSLQKLRTKQNIIEKTRKNLKAIQKETFKSALEENKNPNTGDDN